MTNRYRGPNAAKLRVQRVRTAWSVLAEVIREEAARPLYCGPDPREIEAIGDRALAELDDALFAWTARIAALPRLRPARARLREVIVRRRTGGKGVGN